MLRALTCSTMSYYGSLIRVRHAGSFERTEMAFTLRTQSYPLLLLGDMLRYWWNNESGVLPVSAETDWVHWREGWQW